MLYDAWKRNPCTKVSRLLLIHVKSNAKTLMFQTSMPIAKGKKMYGGVKKAIQFRNKRCCKQLKSNFLGAYSDKQLSDRIF
jgi:hypothetical protein